VRILLVGGIFGKPTEYRRAITRTPETVLADGLRARGHDVHEHGHAPPFDLHGFDVVHVHHLAPGALAAVSARPPERVAFTPHWLRHVDVPRRVASRYVMRHASAVVALSDTEASWQRRELPDVAARQFVIPNGIDPNLFRFAAPRPRDDAEAWRLLFVGQLARFKGVEYLLRALARLDPALAVELDLVYQVDSEEAALKREVSDLGLGERVRFLGARSPAQLAQLYAQAHVFVLPSTGEALPSVISEALFVGRPVVSTDVGAVREQVGDFGEVVAPRDPVALARAVARVLDEYEGYARSAREHSDAAVRRYSIDAMVTAHEAMYESMMEHPKPTASRARRTLDTAARLALRARRSRAEPVAQRTVRVLHVISRLNVGGTASQVLFLTQLLNERGYQATLIRGSEEPSEGSMDYLAAQLDVVPQLLPAIRRNVGWHDLRALAALCIAIARLRPDVVHTHAAKAGALGRLAAGIAPGRSDRVLVHTFHGHSLSGYFSSPAARVFRSIERLLARRTARLVAVSEQVRDDLVALKVADAERFEIIGCGFDFSPFAVPDAERAARRERLRAEIGVPSSAQLVTLVARLVPIKRVDRFLRMADVLAERGHIHFLVVGDGELRNELERSPVARRLGDRLIWSGFRRDIPDVCFASDLVALTSDNEGTPISLIEALAAGIPVVSTDVGGVAAVVSNGESGLLVAPDDEQRLAEQARRLLEDRELSQRLARQGRRHVLESFGLERLIDEHDLLYQRLLSTAGNVRESS
jgi:glycosyltransferase involved in cell wall biosynthesis